MATREPPVAPRKRVQNTRASHDIIAALRGDIASGAIPLGSRLPPETELAEHYGVSKPTVREALRSLDSMGLIEVRHGSGTYVQGDTTFLVLTALQVTMQIERVGILDALAVRETLGATSARWAAEKRTDDEVDLLETAYARFEEPFEDLNDLIEAIAVFQELVTSMSHNPLMSTLESVLIRSLLQMQFKALRARGLEFWAERAIGFQPDRRALLDAIAAGDPERAAAASAVYSAHQREVFTSDPELTRLVFSDASALRVAEELSLAVRQRAAG